MLRDDLDPVGVHEASPVRENGPWHVVTYGDRVDIQSDDSTHDAALTVSGDFEDAGQKRAYADLVAARLNAWKAPLAEDVPTATVSPAPGPDVVGRTVQAMDAVGP